MLDRRPIKSPCISVCVMDAGTGWCEGCFRSLAEIGAWGGMSHDDRDRVMADLPARKKRFETRGAAR